jgi:hypothetical protein
MSVAEHLLVGVVLLAVLVRRSDVANVSPDQAVGPVP